MAPPLSDLIFLVLQLFYKYNMYESAQNLEQESNVYFNLETFMAMIKVGCWEKVRKYLGSFIHPGDCFRSMMIFWTIGREKYLEALDQNDFAKALSVYDKDLRPLCLAPPEFNQELIDLIPLGNFRKNDKYAQCGDTKSMRAQLAAEVGGLLKHHPIIKHKLFFPKIDNSRLEILLSQSVHWERLFCNNATGIPAAMSSLFVEPMRSPSYRQLPNVDTELTLRGPYGDDQNQRAGPSVDPRLSLNFNPLNLGRP